MTDGQGLSTLQKLLWTTIVSTVQVGTEIMFVTLRESFTMYRNVEIKRLPLMLGKKSEFVLTAVKYSEQKCKVLA